jgi:hypothetical protein
VPLASVELELCPAVGKEALVNPKDAAATRDNKPRLDLLEHSADIEIAAALLTGAAKYGVGNYRTIPIAARVYGAAIKRHVGAWLEGQELDPESGLSHLAHIGANVHVLFGALDAGTLQDDRGPAVRSEEQEARSSLSNYYDEQVAFADRALANLREQFTPSCGGHCPPEGCYAKHCAVDGDPDA